MGEDRKSKKRKNGIFVNRCIYHLQVCPMGALWDDELLGIIPIT